MGDTGDPGLIGDPGEFDGILDPPVKGELGDPGIPGLPGLQGDRGFMGFVGPKGIKGIQGDAGRMGFQVGRDIVD